MENEIEKKPDLEKDPTTERVTTLKGNEIPENETTSDVMNSLINKIPKDKKNEDNNTEHGTN